MIKSRALATAISLAAVAAVAPGVADAKPKGMKYAGKLKEGSKVSFVLQGPWVKNLSTMLPYTCGSAQGGLPPIGLAGMCARRGEVQAARAACRRQIPFIQSTVSLCRCPK